MTMLLVAAATTALTGLLLQPPTIRAMTRLAVIDYPSARSSHDVPTPRGGGCAIVLAAIAGLALAGAPATLLWAITLFSVLGLAEDVRGISVRVRLGIQLGAGALLAAAVVAGTEADGLLLWVILIAVTGWLAGVVNVFNFMDGINGISSLQVIVGGLGYALSGSALDCKPLADSGLILSVAAATFLPWNTFRTKVFLGDVGSYGLGAALGLLAVLAITSHAPLEAAIAPLAVYLADTTWTLIRRVRAGEDWLSAHRSHVYQRLTILGWSHLRVASLCGVLSSILITLGMASLSGSIGLRVVADFAATILLAAYLAAPAMLQRMRQAKT